MKEKLCLDLQIFDMPIVLSSPTTSMSAREYIWYQEALIDPFFHQLPPNFERILYVYSDKNSALCQELMGKFDESGEAKLPKDLHDKVLTSYNSAIDPGISVFINASVLGDEKRACRKMSNFPLKIVYLMWLYSTFLSFFLPTHFSLF